MQTYSDESRRNDPYALPDVEVFQLTAEEAVEQDEELMYEAETRFQTMRLCKTAQTLPAPPLPAQRKGGEENESN